MKVIAKVYYVKPLRLSVKKRVGYVKPLKMTRYGSKG